MKNTLKIALKTVAVAGAILGVVSIIKSRRGRKSSLEDFERLDDYDFYDEEDLFEDEE